VCVNLNDAAAFGTLDHPRPVHRPTQGVVSDHRLPVLRYGVASHFPNCYVIPGKDREATAAKRQAYFNRQWVRIVSGLSPRMAFPFAAGRRAARSRLIWANEPTSNAERPTDIFRAQYPSSTTVVADIAPGFALADDAITHKALRSPTSVDRMQSEREKDIERANNYDRPA